MFVIGDIFLIAIAAATIAGGVIIYEHWDEIKSWLKDWFNVTIDLIKDVFKGFWHATKVIIKAAADGFAEITTTLFYGKNGDIIAKPETRKIPKDKLPSDIRKAYDEAVKKGKPMDITDEMEKRLELAYSAK